MFRRRRPKNKGRRGHRTSAANLRPRLHRIEQLENRWMLSAAEIIAENQLPGSSDWEVNGRLSANIQGYAVQFSINQGETVQFKIATPASDYRLDIYRIGWYGGAGGRKVATVQPTNLQSQPNPLILFETNTVDASNWHVSASWNVPSTAVSGVYLAKLVREDGVYGENQIIFVVRDDDGYSDLLFQTSDTTWQAYNTWGGSSTYWPNYPNGRALAVSYSRPFANRDDNPLNYFFGEEYAMIRFLERNGYDVSYTSGIDTARYGSELLEHKVFLSVGHDEYWSGEQRDNVKAARDAGVHLAFFGGNDMFWKHRWGSNAAGQEYTTLIVYKETLVGAKIDPLPDVWTGTWRDPRFPQADGGLPENELIGTMFQVNSNGDLGSTIDVSGQFAGLRFWRHTQVANLGSNQSLSLGDRVLGYEWNDDVDNGFRPAGLIPLSYTVRTVPQYLQDYGSYYARGTSTHSLTLYRAASGALVFSAGTIQYSWALDDQHAVYNAATDRNLQQATVNLFADMGAQPGSIMAGLIATTASSDVLGPISMITSPAVGAMLPSGSQVTVTGTASDRGGGVIAVVEVSVDGGRTWRRASGRESWSYTFTTRGSGQFIILSRAVDDSGNIEMDGPRVEVNPVLNPGVYSLWRDIDRPGTASVNEPQSLELGMRFVSDVNGTVTGIRFYKGPGNTGTHIGNLWTNTGQLLATATFTNESADGWQTVNFSTPVPILAGVTYIASYYAPNGNFSVDRNYFDSQGVSNGPLHAVPTGPAGGNGVFVYNNNSAFPTQTHQNSNYWVDVVLNTNVSNDDTPPVVESFETADGSDAITTDSSFIIKLSESVNIATVNSNTVQLLNPDPNSIPGGCCSTPGGWCSGCPLAMGANIQRIAAKVTYSPTDHTILVTPNAPLATSSIYTVLVVGGENGVRDLAGNPLTADVGASFLTPAQHSSVRSSIFANNPTPATIDVRESLPVELGVRFTADSNGLITGLRFYKSAANTGVHIANLWSSTGQRLATATFTNETGDGWQEVTFASPVAITAGTTYVASYHTSSGRFSVNRNYFTSSADVGMLNVPANAGVFVYGASAFPTQSYQSSNYWVDVVLKTFPEVDNTPPVVTAFTPTNAAANVGLNASATVKFSEAIDPASVTAATVKLVDSGNNFVPSIFSYNANTMMVVITPTSQLAYGETYNIVVQGGAFGIKDVAGNPLAQTIASPFTTISAPAPDLTPPSVVSSTPGNGAVNISPSGVITVTFSESLNAATVDINSILLLRNATNRVTASVSYNDATRTVTVTPAGALESNTSYTIFAIGGVNGVRDLAGNAMDADFVSSFMTSAATVTSSLWTSAATPSTVDVRESAAVELGVRFTSDVNGYITGLRFYKSAGNTGTHIGNLWTSTGQLLATATFVNETTSGWQQVNFSTPVAITAGTTYVASYFAPRGNFSVNRNYFTSAADAGMLNTPAGAGVFRYGTTTGFPSQSYQNSNYWVDVVMSSTPPADTTAPTVTSTSPANAATNVPVSSAVMVYFSEAMNPATVANSTVKILDGNTIVSANVAYNSNNNSATITPATPLANGKTYSISVVGGFQGVKDAVGNPLAQTFTSSFTTAAAAAPDTTPPTISSFSPANGSANVTASASLTVTFSESVDAASVNATTVRLLQGATALAATVSYNAATRTATIVPTAALGNSTSYAFSIVGGAAGVKDLAGNALVATTTSTFTTAAAAPTTLWPSTTTPGTVDVREAPAVELGVQFTADVSGFITGMRFYKSAANTGIHIGNLWSSTGQLLASATFINETASGWQQVNFSTPVAITAGTTYVASYFAPRGHFSVNRNYFGSASTGGMLNTPAGAGVFRYGSSSGFPTLTYQNSNYWVDVLFSPSAG